MSSSDEDYEAENETESTGSLSYSSCTSDSENDGYNSYEIGRVSKDLGVLKNSLVNLSNFFFNFILKLDQHNKNSDIFQKTFFTCKEYTLSEFSFKANYSLLSENEAQELKICMSLDFIAIISRKNCSFKLLKDSGRNDRLVTSWSQRYLI